MEAKTVYVLKFFFLCSPVNPPTVQPPTAKTQKPAKVNKNKTCFCNKKTGADKGMPLDAADFLLFYTV